MNSKVLYERNFFNGEKVRKEEYDILQKVRQKELPCEKKEMQLMRLWKKFQDEKLQLAEEIIIL